MPNWLKKIIAFFKKEKPVKVEPLPKVNPPKAELPPTPLPTPPPVVAPPTSHRRLLGIDVSHHNGVVNWKKIKEAGVDFAYIKCTEGKSFFDPMFIKNVLGARSVGIPVGAYHFFHPGMDAVVQANFFWSKIKDLNLELVPDCDWEVHDDVGEAAQVSQIRLFTDKLESLCRKVPMIYTGKWYIDQVDAKNPREPLPLWLTRHRLWLSDYSPSSVAIPKPWTKYDLLQITEKGTLPGVPGHFDLNWLDKPLSTLQ